MGRSELDASSTSLADTSKQDWQSALATLAKTLEEKSKGSPQIEQHKWSGISATPIARKRTLAVMSDAHHNESNELALRIGGPAN